MCVYTPRSTFALPPTLAAPQLAREFLTHSACPHHALPILEDAVLLTSEAVANAVVHGAPPITLAVECSGVAVEIRIGDGSPGEPVRQEPMATDTSGRGMFLVDLLSDDWGVERIEGDGKEVWFRLRAL